MTYVVSRGTLKLSDRKHTWKDGDGIICSVVDLGAFEFTFDSADEARAVAARCLEAAADIDAMAASEAEASTP